MVKTAGIEAKKAKWFISPLVVERTEQAVNSCYVAAHGKSTFPHIVQLCVLDGDIDFTRRLVRRHGSSG